MAIKVSATGQTLLRNPLLNKGTAFTPEEKELFHLYGLLPANTETISEQLQRCRDAYAAKQSPLEQHIYLRALQDRNEVLFYRFVLENLTEMLPIIYTPTVGEACRFFHHIYRQPRGLFISYPEAHKMDAILASIAQERSIRVIVVTDGERILGLGDQGAGGLGIPIGKLSLYTVCGGINPGETLPIVLDVGTNNQEKLNDPQYLGWRHTRINGSEYDHFVDQFVQGVKRHFPQALLQFEDFAQQHAYPLLQRYREQLCTFNDDIQGTAAVTVAAIMAATRISNMPLREHRIALLGAGSAGCGISEQLVQMMVSQGLGEQEARSRFYLVDRLGLLHDELPGLLPFQKPFAHSRKSLSGWQPARKQLSLLDVIQHAQPTILLGVSGQANQFTQTMVETMGHYCQRPIIFPLSNPTSRAEATPNDLLTWTKGRALVATGSPFAPVYINGEEISISQCNNSYIFPGIGLAVVAGKIKRVTDGMMMAAALALSELAPATITGQGCLLPELTSIRKVSQHIAKAVLLEAIKEKHADAQSEKNIETAIHNTMWFPDYQPYIHD
ncbi:MULTISPECIES: NAD-dependent malic enzyme [Legionella]|uniref:NAD-dependent malic enzyme n=1 Tax=Legionella TaxID=445 RepID=UPI000F8E27F5|nr:MULTISPECIES: NAD-dependent malic enzyme [Legionella]MCP0913720.1 NAD-dependent malic enzyme [Legionella sp. 27cVA30]RUQ99329.1 NAD-dependent malic enzyme [Legionella septentrionalis]RUR14806.1 NAD-dependent malic enzyme [Legionella septentrionalis]